MRRQLEKGAEKVLGARKARRKVSQRQERECTMMSEATDKSKGHISVGVLRKNAHLIIH